MTLMISFPRKCAAHAVAVPQVDPMRVQMIALKAMKETTRVKAMKETTRVKEMKAKVMMAPLETMKKVTLVMTPQEKKENVLMTTLETDYKLETLITTSVGST